MTETRSGLIPNRRAAAIAVLLMALVWIVSVRSCLSGSKHHAGTDLPWHFGFLGRWAVVGDVVFYAWILYVSIAIFRTVKGKERWLSAAFLFPILLIPVRYLPSGIPPTALQYAGVTSYTAALVAALLIFRDR